MWLVGKTHEDKFILNSDSSQDKAGTQGRSLTTSRYQAPSHAVHKVASVLIFLSILSRGNLERWKLRLSLTVGHKESHYTIKISCLIYLLSFLLWFI